MPTETVVCQRDNPSSSGTIWNCCFRRLSDTTNKDFEAPLAGGFILLRPVSEAARTWVKDHLPEDTPALGQHLAIETRHAPPIFDGIEDDGLTIA